MLLFHSFWVASKPGPPGVFPGSPDLAKAGIPSYSAVFLEHCLEGLTHSGESGRAELVIEGENKGIFNFFEACCLALSRGFSISFSSAICQGLRVFMRRREVQVLWVSCGIWRRD